MTLPPALLEGPEVLIFGGLIVLGLLIIIVTLLATDGGGKRYRRRIEQVRRGRHTSQEAEQHLSAKRRTQESNIAFIDRMIKQALPRREALRARLERAGLKITLGRYLMSCLICGIVIFAGAAISGYIPILAAVFIGLISAIGLPHFFIGMLANRRQSKFIARFPEAIDLMVRGLKSGLPISEAIKNAGEEIADPVGAEFRGVTDSVKMGNKLEDMLWEVAKRLDLQEFKFFTVSLSIQSETGGNLAETLENLSTVLRGRRTLKLKIRALSSEAKTSAYIIGSLPFIMTTLIYMINPGYIMDLVNDPRGQVMIGLGFASFFVGTFVMYRMCKFEV